jgi:hypothetical protein
LTFSHLLPAPVRAGVGFSLFNLGGGVCRGPQINF